MKFLEKAEFSKREVRDIIISVLALGFLFSFASGFLPQGFPWAYNFIAACLVVGLAFVVHELSHKFVAQKYDCKAEYVLFPQFLIISIMVTVLSAMMTNGQSAVVFAAPGFVAISTLYATRLGYRRIYLTRKEVGEIAIAGPLSGITLALFLKLFQFLNPLLISYMISINLVIAVFNLFPVPPLDGSKVMAWNPIAWLAMIVIGGMLIFLLPVIDLLLTAAIIVVSALVIFLAMQVFVPKPV